jgi:hypothetical protein
MKTLWVFGDSFSAGLGLDRNPKSDWRKKYIDWKGYSPNSYYELLADYFDMKIINHANDGQSNYHIFQTFCEVSPYIKSDDFVIIQWSETCRFRLVSNNSWQGIGSWHIDNKQDGFDSMSQTTINEILINRLDNPIHYISEVHAWMTLINQSLPNSKILFWTPFDEPHLYKVLQMSHLSTISDETNDILRNGHFGETGHLHLFNELKPEFEKYKKII